MKDLAPRLAALPKPRWWASAGHKQTYQLIQDLMAEDILCDELIGIYRAFIIKESQQAQACHNCVRRFKVNMTETLKLVQEVEAQLDAL